MYTSFFRLNEPPFSLTPDPRYLYMSERHREGLAHLLYGVRQSGGFIQLTGEIGCGKTTLCRCLVNQLPPETDIALILNPRLTAIELLATFCDELHIPYPAGTESIKILIDALNRYLLDSHAKGRRTVLIIDEAQNLHPDVLEQIRLLTNLETEQEKLLQIILIGQPELLSVLKHSNLRQLAQRITARYHLLPLSRQETYAYIQHRLRIAGRSDPVFSRRAARCVYSLTGGVPRLINTLCDRAMLGAYTLDKQHISAKIIRKSGREIMKTVPLRRYRRIAYLTGIAALAALFVAAAILFHAGSIPGFRGTPPAPSGPTTDPDAAKTASEPPGTASPGGAISRAQTSEPEIQAPERIQTPDNVITVDNGTGPVSEPVKNENVLENPGTAPESPGQQAASRFTEIISTLSQNNSLAKSFHFLYRRWGIDIRLKPSDLGCTAGKDLGMECLFLAGDWQKIRRLDIPVILVIQPSINRKLYMTLIGLTGNAATLAIDDQVYTFPVSDMNPVWSGSFITIWKPPFDKLRLSPGTSGEEVLWVRRALDAFDGKTPSDSLSPLFDEDLTKRILAFQKSQSLIPDGRIGPETLIRLAVAYGGSSVPSLSRPSK